LDRSRAAGADRLAVGTGAVAAYDLDAGITARPFLDDVRDAAGQDIGAPPVSTVDTRR